MNKEYKRNIILIVIAIVTGLILAVFSWLVKPLAWKYTFNYQYLSPGLICFLDNPASLKLIPGIVFLAFEAMFIYAFLSPLNSLLLMVVIIPVMNIRFVSASMNIYLPAIFLLAVFLSNMSRVIIKPDERHFKLKAADFWGIIFLFYLWLSLGRSRSLASGLKEVFSLTAFFMAYYSLRLLAWDREAIFKLTKLLACIGVVVAGQALIHFYLMKRGFLDLYEGRFYRAYASFGDPALLANFFLMIIPIAAGFYFEAAKKKWLIILFILIMTMALFLTFSRSAWVSFGLTVSGLILFKLKGAKKLICLPVLAIILAGFFVMSQDRYVVSDRLEPDNRLRSLYVRRDMMVSSFSLIKKFPLLGAGPGNFSYFNTAYDTRDMVNMNVPNTYLHTLIISGGLGLGGLLAFLIFSLWPKRRYHLTPGYLLSGIYTGIIANLIHGLFENVFYNIISNWIFGLVLGLGLACQENSSLRSSSSSNGYLHNSH